MMAETKTRKGRAGAAGTAGARRRAVAEKPKASQQLRARISKAAPRIAGDVDAATSGPSGGSKAKRGKDTGSAEKAPAPEASLPAPSRADDPPDADRSPAPNPAMSVLSAPRPPDGVAAFQEEIEDFSRRLVGHGAMHAQELLRARTLPELLEAQTRQVGTLTDVWLRHLARMQGIWLSSFRS
jgi:hypothetical protein